MKIVFIHCRKSRLIVMQIPKLTLHHLISTQFHKNKMKEPLTRINKSQKHSSIIQR